MERIETQHNIFLHNQPTFQKWKLLQHSILLQSIISDAKMALNVRNISKDDSGVNLPIENEDIWNYNMRNIINFNAFISSEYNKKFFLFSWKW